jgi:hypothetical protein
MTSSVAGLRGPINVQSRPHQPMGQGSPSPADGGDCAAIFCGSGGSMMSPLRALIRPFAAVGGPFVGPSGRHLALALPIVLSISLLYLFMASAGTFQDLRRQSRYDLMAEGFQRGHLYISQRPSRKLLAQEDPFHPSNKPIWMWDSTLYEGHLYLYWGPVPALLTWAFKAATGHARTISDQTLTVAFALGRLFAGAAILLGLGRFIRIRQPAWIVGSSIAVFGLTSPIPFIVARPYVYEACLMAGQCFLFAGLAFAFWGLVSPSHRVLKFITAGSFWGLAIGSRVTMSIPIPLMVLATVGLIWFYTDRSWRRLLINGIALGTPVAAALISYGVYNYLRFGSPTEFGVTWQLTTQKFITNDAWVIPNIFSYLFAPVDWSCEFPFVRGLKNRPLSPWINWPSDYETFELVAGLMFLSGWCWLIVVAAWRPVRAGWTYLRRRGLPTTPSPSMPELWASLCSIAIMLSMIPVLGLWEASMRYSGDAIGGLIILTALTAFWLLRRADAASVPGVRLGTRAVILLLGLHSCLVGAASGVASYNDPFKKHNPALYETLQRTLSVCKKAVASGTAIRERHDRS